MTSAPNPKTQVYNLQSDDYDSQKLTLAGVYQHFFNGIAETTYTHNRISIKEKEKYLKEFKDFVPGAKQISYQYSNDLYPEDNFIVYDFIDDTKNIIIRFDSDEKYFNLTLMGSKMCQPLVDTYARFNKTVRESYEDKLNLAMVIKTPDGLDSRVFKFALTNQLPLTLQDSYNDDFPEFDEHVQKALTTNSKGIVLLHGLPGTGKTNYLKFLIGKLKHRKIIYLPPDLAGEITSPSFISFMTENANSLLIIEDAEKILLERQAGDSTQAVTNLLNMSDGLLSEILKIQIIATFNTDIDKIDNALRRPGRLIGSYEFKRLTIEKSNALLRKIHKNEIDVKKELTLSEIINYNNEPCTNDTRPKKHFGFSVEKNEKVA